VILASDEFSLLGCYISALPGSSVQTRTIRAHIPSVAQHSSVAAPRAADTLCLPQHPNIAFLITQTLPSSSPKHCPSQHQNIPLLTQTLPSSPKHRVRHPKKCPTWYDRRVPAHPPGFCWPPSPLYYTDRDWEEAKGVGPSTYSPPQSGSAAAGAERGWRMTVATAIWEISSGHVLWTLQGHKLNNLQCLSFFAAARKDMITYPSAAPFHPDSVCKPST